MVLTGNEIRRQIQKKQIQIMPFEDSNINPNSYDIHIGETIMYYQENVIIDAKENAINNWIEQQIPKEGLILQKEKFYFAYSKEIVGSSKYVPILHNKSGVARKGMFMHITGDLQQLNQNKHIMLQIFPFANTIIFPNQQLAQVSFWKSF